MAEEVKVRKIKDGTVIDHIPSEATIRAMEILRDKMQNHMATMGVNFSSKRLGKKGFIKIEGTVLTQDEANRIAIVAPKATLNLIRDGKVVKKSTLELPSSIVGVLRCPNPECISGHEPMVTHFVTLSDEPLKLRCHYCERMLRREDLMFA